MAAPTLDDMEAPYSTTEMQHLCEQGRLLFDTIYDRLSTLAVELKHNLSQIQGSPALMGVDAKMSARRTVKPLLHAAGLSRESATSMKNAWIVYQGLYLPKAGTKSSFNING